MVGGGVLAVQERRLRRALQSSRGTEGSGKVCASCCSRADNRLFRRDEAIHAASEEYTAHKAALHATRGANAKQAAALTAEQAACKKVACCSWLRRFAGF